MVEAMYNTDAAAAAVDELVDTLRHAVGGPHARLVDVAQQALLVGAGLRRAALIDAFPLTETQCTQLASALAAERVHTPRMRVFVLVYLPAGQVFLVNRRLAAHDTLPQVYVQADAAPPHVIPEPGAMAHFARLLREPRSLLCIDAPGARAWGVAVCGWLLEYPYIYALAAHRPPEFVRGAWRDDDWSDAPNCLAHEPLCGIAAALGSMPVLQCTFPESIGAPDARLHTAMCAVRDMLAARLAPAALAHSGFSAPLQRALAAKTPAISCFRTVQDRVAL